MVIPWATTWVGAVPLIMWLVTAVPPPLDASTNWRGKSTCSQDLTHASHLPDAALQPRYTKP